MGNPLFILGTFLIGFCDVKQCSLTLLKGITDKDNKYLYQENKFRGRQAGFKCFDHFGVNNFVPFSCMYGAGSTRKINSLKIYLYYRIKSKANTERSVNVFLEYTTFLSIEILELENGFAEFLSSLKISKFS